MGGRLIANLLECRFLRKLNIMNLQEIIKLFDETSEIGTGAVAAFKTNELLRKELLEHFKANQNRIFAFFLLKSLTTARENVSSDVAVEDLMLACYILGMHNHIEDSLVIWKTKCIDFDTYCGFDIQLVVFAGFQKTKSYFETAGDPEADKALEYITACYKLGDFDELTEYFSRDKLPWFL